MDRVPVSLYAPDPLSQLGVTTALRTRPELQVLGADAGGAAAVHLVVAETLDDVVMRLLRRLYHHAGARVVLVVANAGEASLPEALECGVVGVLRRVEATPDRLANAIISAARGESSLPADLVARLLNRPERAQRPTRRRSSRSFSSLDQREIDVLQLISEGYDTAEIARKLSYSERTVKGILHEMTSRLRLRNRSHAVAYALRQGFI